MKIVILDRNNAVLEYFSSLLENFDVKTFSNEKESLEYVKNKKDEIDFIFVEEFFYETFIEINLNSFFIILFFEIKDLEIKERIYYSIQKDILPLEFKAKFSIIKKLREYFLKENQKKSELKNIILYKEQHEEIAIQKQLKLFSNELSMFYENDYMIETYFHSKDLLSGDGVLTKRIDENRYFVAVIDAMGKGLSASLTSTNSVGFLHYALIQSLEHNDFNFKYIIESFVNYIKSILIENETLCFVAGYVENNSFEFVNFGMPPIYVDREKIRANNMPVNEWTDEINVSNVEFKKDILMFSDGLIECETKNERLYLTRFKQLLPNFIFLNDILRDYKKNAIQSDDTTIIYLKKEKWEFKKLYSETIDISIDNINEFLRNFDSKIKVENIEKMSFILQELLMNSYEHSALKLQKLKNSVLRKDKIDLENDTEIKAEINILENDLFVKLEYIDNGDGFDIDVLKTLGKDKFHGRGIKMIKSIADGFFYNPKGNGVNIYFIKAK